MTSRPELHPALGAGPKPPKIRAMTEEDQGRRSRGPPTTVPRRAGQPRRRRQRYRGRNRSEGHVARNQTVTTNNPAATPVAIGASTLNTPAATATPFPP